MWSDLLKVTRKLNVFGRNYFSCLPKLEYEIRGGYYRRQKSRKLKLYLDKTQVAEFACKLRQLNLMRVHDVMARFIVHDVVALIS